jgi:hypothetical protein
MATEVTRDVEHAYFPKFGYRPWKPRLKLMAVWAMMKHLPAEVQAMVQIQLLTGMRDREVIGLRGASIDCDGKVWQCAIDSRNIGYAELRSRWDESFYWTLHCWEGDKDTMEPDETLELQEDADLFEDHERFSFMTSALAPLWPVRVVNLGPTAQSILGPWLKTRGKELLFVEQYFRRVEDEQGNASVVTECRQYSKQSYRSAIRRACIKAMAESASEMEADFEMGDDWEEDCEKEDAHFQMHAPVQTKDLRDLHDDWVEGRLDSLLVHPDESNTVTAEVKFAMPTP